ncbi:MAG: DEAD/DEAH box helicase family protein [Lachnospiraceae bacterium]|nr:DEAD/DEAH box helicase family protein [Lachnospiraceae bacterium]
MSDTDRKLFFQQRVVQYRMNPVLFAQEVLCFDPDEWQYKVLQDLSDGAKVAVKSGQGVGKTGVEAVALLWFLTCFPYPRIVATAPTKQQLHDVLWSEISKWLGKSPLLNELLKWTKTYIYLRNYEKRWFAVARTATKPENMQGFHEDNMLFIVDEASGVADPIMEAIMGTLSGQNNKLLMCGNPTKTSGTFFDAFHADRNQYKLHTVSSRNSKRTNKDNIASLDRKYGRDSNVVRVRVDGEFPNQEDDVFIPLSWLEQSVSTEIPDRTAKALGVYRNNKGELLPADPSAGVDVISIGCDVARFGDDKTCIGYRVNEVVKIFKKYNGQDTTWTASNIALLYKELRQKHKNYHDQIYVRVDDGGVGGGVVDQLRAFKRSDPIYDGMTIMPVNFGQPIKGHKYYADTTTYMMGVVRDLITPFDEAGNDRTPEIILPNDDDLVAQLSCRKYAFTSNAKQKVESKEEMKKRGLTSPDEADCILLVCLPIRTKGKGKEDNGKETKDAGSRNQRS